MCTEIEKHVAISGAGKGLPAWFPLTDAVVCYDHPLNALLEQSVILDFSNYSRGTDSRVVVEIPLESARSLAHAILEVVRLAEIQESKGSTNPAPKT